MATKVKIGDKYKEKLPSWVKGKNRYFSWEYEVVGFSTEPWGGKFADCVCTYPDGKQEKVGIDLELLKGTIFYEKVA